MLEELLSDLVNEEHIIMAINNGNAVAEVKISNLPIKVSEEWIRIGVEGSSHVHIRKKAIRYIQFLKEERSNGRMSFSIRLLDDNNERIASIYFTNMYDDSNNLRLDRAERYERIFNRYGAKQIIDLSNT